MVSPLYFYFKRYSDTEIDRQTWEKISIRESCPKYDTLYTENVRYRYWCLMIHDINFMMKPHQNSVLK